MKLVIKRLTPSDLTFFECQFHKLKAGNQKAINLNATPFVTELYPALPEIAEELGGKIPVDLSIYGPGGAGQHNIQRKIVKFGAYKNWRLNGEFVYNPPDEHERYDALQPGDIAVFAFEGSVKPQSATLILISASHEDDIALHKELEKFLEQGSMRAISEAELREAIDHASVSGAHPIRNVYIDEVLTDASLGGSESEEKLFEGPSRRNVSRDRLQNARRQADENGRRGETFIYVFLERLKAEGKVDDFAWISDENAVAPYDFTQTKSGEESSLDVKSTTGPFNGNIHISYNELLTMADDTVQYDLYRIYEMNGSEAKLRIAEDIGEFARDILTVLNQLPEGIRADGISCSPEYNRLSFGEEIRVILPQEEQDT